MKKGYSVEKRIRNKEVLLHLAQGMTAKEIGEKLGVSNRTVEDRIAKMKVELNARNQTHLVAKAILGNWFSIMDEIKIKG